MNRTVTRTRTTKETDITVTLNLDGTGKTEIDTGIGFFDHMLNGFARHGLFDLTVHAKGDLEVDSHHTIEDTGIVLGQAILEAIGDKAGIKRYGHFMLPMDETLMLCAIDLSGRPYFVMDCDFTVDRVGEFDTEMVREFFYAVSYGSMMNLHLKKLHGENKHLQKLWMKQPAWIQGSQMYFPRKEPYKMSNEAKPLNSKMSFDEFKLNSDGMLTVVVQDHKTNEVLMVAYMTKEAYDKTIETGIMTYYSRSRDELWIKGETSGHYQYVKDLYIDCDRDTLLAKVKQIGAACHTGNYSCFYTDLLEKED